MAAAADEMPSLASTDAALTALLDGTFCASDSSICTGALLQTNVSIPNPHVKIRMRD
jgi:hypothetical protein